jgi:hypothetical protein
VSGIQLVDIDRPAAHGKTKYSGVAYEIRLKPEGSFTLAPDEVDGYDLDRDEEGDSWELRKAGARPLAKERRLKEGEDGLEPMMSVLMRARLRAGDLIIYNRNRRANWGKGNFEQITRYRVISARRIGAAFRADGGTSPDDRTVLELESIPHRKTLQLAMSDEWMEDGRVNFVKLDPGTWEIKYV